MGIDLLYRSGTDVTCRLQQLLRVGVSTAPAVLCSGMPETQTLSQTPSLHAAVFTAATLPTTL